MEKNFNHEESLTLINEMIGRARNNVHNERMHFIFWGYTVAAVAILNYALLHILKNPNQSFWVWCLTIPALIVSHFIGKRGKKVVLVKTHIDKIGNMLWKGHVVGVAVFLIIIFAAAIKYEVPQMFTLINPIIMVFVGICEFASACIYRYKVWYWVAALFWVSAIVCAFLPVDLHFIILALCMIAGFVVPGHILNYQLKKSHA